MLRALAKLPDVEGHFYRGSILAADELKAAYYAGRQVQWTAFTSTSKRQSTALKMAGPTGTILCIKAWTGKDISDFSLYKHEREVLMLPNRTFVVMKQSTRPFSVDASSGTKVTMPTIELIEVRKGDKLVA